MQVLIGGGENHRMGLYDMVMVKDNHIAVAGGIQQAISAVDNYLNSKNLKIGVEVSFILELSLICISSGVADMNLPHKVSIHAVGFTNMLVLLSSYRYG